MKKKMRHPVWILVAIGVAVAFSAFFFSQNKQTKIADFVITNESELESIALNCLDGDETIAEYKGVEVGGVYSGEHQIVQFDYSGSGVVPSTTYYGFYYSRDNVPTAFQNAEIELVSASDDEWTWDDGTDNGGLTKRITECWFYYEARF